MIMMCSLIIRPDLVLKPVRGGNQGLASAITIDASVTHNATY